MFEEEMFPKFVGFEDGSAIIAYSLANEKYTVKHGDKKFSVKSIFVSNYAQAGGIIKTEPIYCIVVEHPYDKEVLSDDLELYVCEFVRTIRNRVLNQEQVAYYIGRRDKELDNMIISQKVQREIVDEKIEPELRKRRMDRDYKKRAELLSTMKNQNEK